MSSDEEIAPRRKRNVQVIRDEDEQKLLIESCRSAASRAGASPALSVPDAAEDASNGSSASDGQSERCPICLNRFLGQEEGTPESCDHVFCLDCIQEWARNVNTCPVDRSVFRLILVRQGDKMVRQISVGSPEKEEEEEEEDLTYCEVCGNCDREDRLLLCDACDLGYHCECLTPPLDTVPVEEWYCPDCAPDHSQDEPLSGDAMAEFRELLATRFRPGNTGFRRAIARTRAIVRIEGPRTATLLRHRQAEENDEAAAEDDRQEGEEQLPPENHQGQVGEEQERAQSEEDAPQVGQEKDQDGETSSAESCLFPVGRETRRSRQSARPLAQPLSVRQRIAKRLGLARTPGSSLPLMRHVDLGMGRYSRNFSSQGQGPAHGLSLFGDRDELVSLDGSCDEGSNGDMVSTRRVNPQAARARAKELLLRPAPPRDRVRTTLSRDSLEPCCGDILGKILGQMQSRSPCKNGLTQSILQRNGSLDLRKVPPNTVQKRPRSPGSSTSTSPTQNHADHAVTAAAAPSKRASGDGTCLAASSAATFSGTGGDGASRPFGGDDGDNNHAGSGRDGCFYSTPPDEYVLGKKAKDRPKNGTDNVRESEEEVDIYSDIESLGDDCANHDVGNEDTNNNNNSNNNRDRVAFSTDENTVKSPADRRAGGSDLRHRSAVENDDTSSSENELVIDEQENPVGNAVEEEEGGKGEGSEEEEAALEVASVRSPSPLEENGNISRDSGGVREVVQNGNSSAEEGDEEQQSVGSADGEEGSENGEGEEQLDEEEGALEDSEEEGLVEDNDMEEVSEAGSADGLLDQMDDVVIVEPVKPRRKEEGRRSKKSKRKKEGCHHRKHRRCRNRDEDEDREEGEIVEERSPLKRDKGGYSDAGLQGSPSASRSDSKRTSVLSRVDSGSGGEISWKKLSKHSRERSYRDGKPKDEVILFKEREIKKREREKEKERAELLADDRSSRREEEKRAPKKERRPDRELYVRPDKKKDWHKERSHKDKSSSSSSSSHKDRKDKHKDKEKDKQSSSSGSKEYGHHSSKDRRNDSKDRKEHHRHSSSSRHRRDHSSERSSSKTRQKESRKEERRESRRHEERESREPRESRESRDVREPRETRESRDTRESRESRRGQEEKIKVAVEKDYWKEKHERRKDRSPSPFLEVEPTPIESKEVIAKGDSIIINVNFNRRKEAKPPSPEERDSHRSRDSRSRKRALSPEYDLTDSEDDDSRKKGRLVADMDGRRDDDDESDLGEEDDDRSSIYDDGASSESDYEEKPASPLEAQESPAEEKPSKQDTTPEPLLQPSPPVVQLSPESSPPPSPPSPPEDNSYDPCEPTRSPSPPPVAEKPRPPPEPELPPLPPEPEPARQQQPARQPTRQQPAAPPTPTAVPPVTVAATPTTTAVPSLHLPPPPSFLAPPRSLVVANLHGAWAPTAAPVILGLRAPFVPPALGAILAPPPGMLPPPMMRVLPPAAVTATTTAAAAALPLASGAAATAPKPDHTEVVDMEVDSPYSPPDSPPHGDSFGKEVAKEADRVVSAFDALLPALAAVERKGRSKGSKKHGRTSSKDRKHIVHFTVDKGRAAIGSLVSTFKVDSKSAMRMDESQLKILDELPSSAVEMQVKEKVCHNKSGEINPVKIKALVEGYIRRVKHQRNKPSSGQHRHKPS
ncbi:hypothetical protein IscW_ISCW002529 [Ixodes scapularis]|uniref:Uncharacterized protein n=1 Tax=Ixodes scapularis TaxID=6945 RepID=B7PBN3_IXOSC|nr:hypothetical protein IscW_ISCW002529 [Ixodes scapularis]|eukprot:XP_002408581.1 hypothetical protein IscW_ISCW002529 [Ixodes scapularis]